MAGIKKDTKKQVKEAIRNGDVDTVDQLVDNVYANSKSNRVRSNLALCIEYGQPECLKIFLESGASPSLASDEEPLTLSIKRDRPGCIKMLIDYGADPYNVFKHCMRSQTTWSRGHKLLDAVNNITQLTNPKYKRINIANREKKLFRFLFNNNNNEIIEKILNQPLSNKTKANGVLEAYILNKKQYIEQLLKAGAKPVYVLKQSIETENVDKAGPFYEAFFSQFDIDRNNLIGNADEVLLSIAKKADKQSGNGRFDSGADYAIYLTETLNDHLNISNELFDAPSQTLLEVIKKSPSGYGQHIINNNYIDVEKNGADALLFAYENRDQGYKRIHQALKDNNAPASKKAANHI